MKKYLLLSLAAALSSTSFVSNADQGAVHCLELVQQEPVEMQLSAGKEFGNCFSLTDVPAGAEISIVSMAEADLTHSVRVYELDTQASMNLIGDYDSNGKAVAQVTVPQNDKTVAFSVVPMAQNTLDKHINVHYLHMGASPHVVIEMRNIAQN